MSIYLKVDDFQSNFWKFAGIKREFWLAYLLASRPRPYFWSNVTDLVIRWYRRRASQPLTCFWIMIPQAFSLSERNFSRYATWPARKKIFVLPNLYLSGSWEVKVDDESKMKNIIMKRKVQKKTKHFMMHCFTIYRFLHIHNLVQTFLFFITEHPLHLNA